MRYLMSLAIWGVMIGWHQPAQAQDFTVQGVNQYFCNQLGGAAAGASCRASYRPYGGNACSVFNNLDAPPALKQWFSSTTSTCSPAAVEEAKKNTLIGRARLRSYVSAGNDESVNDPVHNQRFRPGGANIGAGEMYFAAECAVRTCGDVQPRGPSAEEKPAPQSTPGPIRSPTVREHPPQPDPAVLPTVPTNQAVHVGCFAENRSANQFGTAGRSLSGFCLSSDVRSQPRGNCVPSAPMTVTICINECGSRGFAFAGVQYGNSCFCGAAVGNATPSSQCTMPCHGNPGETCGGEWANSVYRTTGVPNRRQDQGTGRAVIPNYPQPNGPCNQAEAKTNIDWVFRDGGARGTMQSGLKRNLSPFDAVLYAQGHNRGAQQSLVNCRAWAEGYIDALGVQGNAPVLGNRRLGPADCACISITRAGNGFGITNVCDPMIVRIFFEGQRLQIAPGAPHSFPDRQRVNAGAIGINLPGFVLRPDWLIASITAYGLENAASEHVTCPNRQ